MQELSFILPVRVDSEDRITNLRCSLRFISRSFPSAEIIVVESDKKSGIDDVDKENNTLRYIFLPTEGSFSKAHVVNSGIRAATRPYVVIWDIDIIIHPAAIRQALSIMKKKSVRLMLPHNTIFLNVAGETKRKFMVDFDFGLLPGVRKLPFRSDNPDLTAYPIPSGVLIAEKNTLMFTGGYNCKMVSYGWEDIEILKRFNKVGFPYYTLGKFNLIHLDHRRGGDSHQNELTSFNETEYHKVLGMSRKQLIGYIKTDLAAGLFSAGAAEGVHPPRFPVVVYGKHYFNRFLNYFRIHGLRKVIGRIIP